MHFFHKPVTVGFLAKSLGLDFHGDCSYEVSCISTLSNKKANSLIFCKSGSHSINDAVVISSCKSFSENVILSENPRLDFIRSLELIDKIVGFRVENSPSFIHPTVIVGENVSIGSNVHIDENTKIESNVSIKSGSKIGSNCILKSGSIIGTDGFGFERSDNGIPIKFIHLGNVIIGNNVEIGANTCVARGTLSDTIIEDHVKIDSLVQISHNCYIKSGAFVLSGVALSGSVVLGSNSWIGPNSVIYQKKKIGNNSVVGIGSVVLSNVKNNITVFGNPAKKLFS